MTNSKEVFNKLKSEVIAWKKVKNRNDKLPVKIIKQVLDLSKKYSVRVIHQESDLSESVIRKHIKKSLSNGLEAINLIELSSSSFGDILEEPSKLVLKNKKKTLEINLKLTQDIFIQSLDWLDKV
ncbi:MAG: hypothetical protein COB02_01870 [Candidatus Cloacimonadota bacterium]|nr:MAG: hypothetical protein COB02_01870 [Candidatus Cloacimonadota bacterium]